MYIIITAINIKSWVLIRKFNNFRIYVISSIKIFTSNSSFNTKYTNIKYKNGFYGDGILSRFPIEYSANYLAPITNATHEQRGILCNKILYVSII